MRLPIRQAAESVRRGYTEEKRREDWYGEWFAALFYRPLSLRLTPVLLSWGVSANAVTLASLAIALALPAVAVWAGPLAYLPVAALALVIGILDCIDGNIARAMGTGTRLGRYLDFLTDVIFRTSFYCAIALIAEGERILPAWLVDRCLALALLAALVAVAGRLCRLYVESFAGERAYAPPDPGRPAGDGAVVRFVFPVLSGLDASIPLAVIAAGLSGVVGWILVWLLGYWALDFLYTQYAILRRLA